MSHSAGKELNCIDPALPVVIQMVLYRGEGVGGRGTSGDLVVSVTIDSDPDRLIGIDKGGEGAGGILVAKPSGLPFPKHHITSPWDERVYLQLCKVADTPFNIQGHYLPCYFRMTIINTYSARIDFSRQNLTSVDVRFRRLKSIPAL